MPIKQDTESKEVSALIELSLGANHSGPQEHFCDSHIGCCGIVVPVIVELLRNVPALSCDEPEGILFLITRLVEIHNKLFMIRILPLVYEAELPFFSNNI